MKFDPETAPERCIFLGVGIVYLRNWTVVNVPLLHSTFVGLFKLIMDSLQSSRKEKKRIMEMEIFNDSLECISNWKGKILKSQKSCPPPPHSLLTPHPKKKVPTTPKKIISDLPEKINCPPPPKKLHPHKWKWINWGPLNRMSYNHNLTPRTIWHQTIWHQGSFFWKDTFWGNVFGARFFSTALRWSSSQSVSGSSPVQYTAFRCDCSKLRFIRSQ